MALCRRRTSLTRTIDTRPTPGTAGSASGRPRFSFQEPMATVTVLLFARYADLVGASKVEVPTTAAGTLGQVVAYLRGLPGGAALPERPLVAVNMEQADLDYRPVPGDEIAVLPPMAGG